MSNKLTMKINKRSKLNLDIKSLNFPTLSNIYTCKITNRQRHWISRQKFVLQISFTFSIEACKSTLTFEKWIKIRDHERTNQAQNSNNLLLARSQNQPQFWKKLSTVQGFNILLTKYFWILGSVCWQSKRQSHKRCWTPSDWLC